MLGEASVGTFPVSSTVSVPPGARVMVPVVDAPMLPNPEAPFMPEPTTTVPAFTVNGPTNGLLLFSIRRVPVEILVTEATAPSGEPFSEKMTSPPPVNVKA